jgi:hypothetical protein
MSKVNITSWPTGPALKIISVIDSCTSESLIIRITRAIFLCSVPPIKAVLNLRNSFGNFKKEFRENTYGPLV